VTHTVLERFTGVNNTAGKFLTGNKYTGKANFTNVNDNGNVNDTAKF
jgi:hypothetical protein